MNKFLISAVVLIVVVVGGYLLLVGNTNSGTSNTLPDITLQTVAGEEVKVADFLDGDTVLVVNSWATWCPFCVHELPDMVTLQEEFSDQIAVIGVNRREEPDETQSYLENLEIADDLVYLYDSSDAWYRAIGGFSMPETLFISQNGEIIVHKRGFMALQEMRDHVRAALAAQ